MTGRTSRSTAGAASGGLSGFGAAMFAALWAYSGWQFLPMAASEVQQPDRNLPRAIIGGTLLVLAIYMLINVAYLYALPLWQVATRQLHCLPGCALGRRPRGADLSWYEGRPDRRTDIPGLLRRRSQWNHPRTCPGAVRRRARWLVFREASAG